MEFVKVIYPSVRGVNLDGGPCGNTGDVLKTSAGTHDFDLGAPLDYTPASITIQVRSTTKTSPLVITFLPKGIAPLIPEVVVATGPARRRKMAKKPAKKVVATKPAKKAAKNAAPKTAKRSAKKSPPKSARKRK